MGTCTTSGEEALAVAPLDILSAELDLDLQAELDLKSRLFWTLFHIVCK